MQNFDHNIGLYERRQFFRRKLSKIATPGVDFMKTIEAEIYR
jgi:hypothetical protein